MTNDDINVEHGRSLWMIQLVLTFILMITPQNVELGIRLLVGLGSATTAVLAGRYYILAAKEKKIQLEISKKLLNDK